MSRSSIFKAFALLGVTPSQIMGVTAHEAAATLAKMGAELARDSANATGKIKPNVVVGIDETENGEYFSIVSVGTNDFLDLYLNSAGTAVYQKTYPAQQLVAQHANDIVDLKNFRTGLLSDVFEVDIPRNLYNPAVKRSGLYVKINAVIDAASGWACSDYIPVIEGQQYTISANGTKREGVAFFTSNLTNTGISGSYLSGGTLPKTVTAPAGANYMVINVQSSSISEPSQVQVEAGAVATTYESWRLPKTQIKRTGLSAAIKSELDTIVKEYEKTITSKNLFDASAIRADKLLSSGNGQINTATGWGVSGFIPVTAGQQYTISGTRGRDGVSFFTAASDLAVISYISTAGLPLTVTAPTGANYMVIALYSASNTSYSQIQVEAGDSVTDYTSVFGSHKYTIKEKVNPEIREMPDHVRAKLVLDPTKVTASYIQALLSGSTSDILQINIAPFNAKTSSTSEVFNFVGDYLNGVNFRDASDDIAPYRVFGGTIGANHGYTKTVCTVTGHNKTTVDVGSVWTDGTNQFVIVETANNIIYVTARTSNNGFVSGTLTHVSGATHTEAFTPSTVSNTQWYPAIKNRRLSVSVDGHVLQTQSGEFYYYDNATFHESYEIMGKQSIVEWLITQVGTSPTLAQYDGTSDISVSMSYVFDIEGNCAIYQDFLALNNISLFQDIMFTQSIKMKAGVSGAVRYYVPKSLPLTHESIAYDFRTLRDMTGFAPSTRINFTHDRCEATGQLCDRMLMLNDSIGIAVGYLPIQSADPSVRRTNASNKALQISEAAKLYMSCIDGLKTSLTANDYFSVVAYRSYFKRSSARTSCYTVRNKTGIYLYADWHAETNDRLPIPSDCVGKEFTVVEKSDNVTVMSQFLTNSLLVKVAAATYGYLVVKLG